MRIGISLASLLPWSAFFPELTARWAKEAGYDFLQALPFRGFGFKEINRELIKGLALPIFYAEQAWNSGNFRDYWQGKKTRDLLAPKLHDWLFFPDWLQSEIIFHSILNIAKPIVIAHSITNLEACFQIGCDKVFLEVHPGMNMTVEQIADWAKDKGRGLVLDTYHLRRSLRPDEMTKLGIINPTSILGDWRYSLSMLLPHTGLIHISPDRGDDEVTRFVQYKGTELYNMLEMIKRFGYEGDFVVEAIIGLRGINPWLLKDTMQTFLTRVKRILQV